jgi:hypothetical protein
VALALTSAGRRRLGASATGAGTYFGAGTVTGLAEVDEVTGLDVDDGTDLAIVLSAVFATDADDE